MQSVRLAQSWTTQCLRAVPRVSLPFDEWVTEDLRLVGGRWLIVCQLDRRFVLYDTDANAQTRAPQVLWEQGEAIIAWDKCLATSKEGQWVVYLLLSTVNSPRWYVFVLSICGRFLFPTTPCRTLLEFQLNAESGALYDTVTLDVPVLNVDRDLELDGGQKLFARSPFLTIPNQNLVFDTRTRVFYKFSDSCIAVVRYDQQKSRVGCAHDSLTARILHGPGRPVSGEAASLGSCPQIRMLSFFGPMPH